MSTRHCDGKDVFLLCAVDPETGERLKRATVGEKLKPCDCGKVFDDVYHEVIWPHRSVW